MFLVEDLFGHVQALCSLQLFEPLIRALLGLSKAQGPITLTLRVQVPNSHILTQNQDYNYYYPNPKYLIIGYMDP